MSKRQYTMKPQKKQKKIIIECIKQFHVVNNDYHDKIFKIEKDMRKKTGIEELEFVHDPMCMGWLGVGTFPPEMELIDIWEYEDE